jgi:hypothetical protein
MLGRLLNNELERILNGAIVAYLRYYPAFDWSEEKHENRQSG